MLKKKAMFAVLSVILCFMLIFVSCTVKEQGTVDSKGGDTVEESTQSGGQQSGEDISLGKYSPPIELTAMIYDRGSSSYLPGETPENNTWTKAIEEKLGIRLKVIWSGSYSDYWRELTLYMASGNLPDLFFAYAEQFGQLLQDDAIEDLTDVYKQYVSPRTHELLQEAKAAFDACHSNGRLMAIPSASNTATAANQLAIRYDWMKNLNLQDPKTMDDLLNIIRAFTFDDPDQNGQDDTFGLIANDMIFTTSAISLYGFANGFHAYPDIWIEDSSGNLVYGSVQPEMKQVLQVLQELFRTGQMDTEIYTQEKGSGAARDTALAGKGGVVFGSVSYVTGAFQQQVEENPSIDWRIYPVVSVDDKPAIPQVGTQVYEFYHCIRKGYEHPEAIIKLANFYVENIHPSNLKDRVQEMYQVKQIVDGKEEAISVYDQAPVWINNTKSDFSNWLKAIGKLAITDEDENALKLKDNLEKFENGDISLWSNYKSNGPEYSVMSTRYFYEEVQKLFMPDFFCRRSHSNYD